MNEIARQPRVAVMPLPGNRVAISGRLTEVSMALGQLRRRGVLVSASSPQLTGVPGEVLVNCRLLPPVQRMPEPPRRLSGRAIAAIVAIGLAVLGGLGWLAYQLLEVVVHNALAIGVVLLVIGLVLTGVGRTCVTHVTIRHHH